MINRLILIKGIVSIMLLGAISCSYNSENTSSNTKSFTINGSIMNIYTGSDGHQYYKAESYNGGNLYFHYPDCELCNKRDSL